MQFDLFNQSKTPTTLLKELKAIYPDTISGNIVHSGNCVLFLMTQVSINGIFEGPAEYILKRTIKDYGFKNHICTYIIPKSDIKLTRSNLKDSISFINNIMDIYKPKLIIAIGDNTCIPLIGSKPLMDVKHGQTLGIFNDCPVIATFDLSYYITREKAFETKEYKQALYDNDWNYIQSEYKRLINADV